MISTNVKNLLNFAVTFFPDHYIFLYLTVLNMANQRHSNSLFASFNLLRDFYQKPLWVHILWGVGGMMLLIFLMYWGISLFTYQGRYREVPDLTGKSVAEAQKILKENDLVPVIRDSMFFTQYPKGAVVKQIPDAQARVKIYRNIYLIVNKIIPPLIEVPKVVGLNISVAEGIIKSSGMGIADTIYRNDMARNIILELRYKDQVLDRTNDKVPMGEKLTIVLGNGRRASLNGNEEGDEKTVWVPDFIGKTLAEALNIAQENRVQLVPQNTQGLTQENASSFYVVKQVPFRYNADNQVNRMPQNAAVLIWVSRENPLQ